MRRIANACNLIHIIGLGVETRRSKHSWTSELRRRRLWACYMTHCHTSDRLTAFESSTAIDNLPLPWTEEEFNSGVPRLPVTTLKSGTSNGGIFSELIKALSIW